MADAGTVNCSLAQAPKSILLHLSLQKGRYRLLTAYTLGPLHVGQVTSLAGTFSVLALITSKEPTQVAHRQKRYAVAGHHPDASGAPTP